MVKNSVGHKKTQPKKKTRLKWSTLAVPFSCCKMRTQKIVSWRFGIKRWDKDLLRVEGRKQMMASSNDEINAKQYSTNQFLYNINGFSLQFSINGNLSVQKWTILSITSNIIYVLDFIFTSKRLLMEYRCGSAGKDYSEDVSKTIKKS